MLERDSLTILLLFLFLTFEIGKSIEKEALIDITTIKDLEIPWMWVASSAEENAPQFVEVIDVAKNDAEKGEKDNDLIGPTSKSQPRFIGNLKNKLCKVGLGIGRSYTACLEELNSHQNYRFKRSPQFVKVDPGDNSEVDHQNSDQHVQAATDKENPETRLFGLNGLDGLAGLLKPTIDPSVGLYFGNPFYNGVRGPKGPFQLDLGPVSVSPFGQLRFTLHNGRPVIRPSVDFLVSSNKKGEYYHPQYQQYPEYPQTTLYPHQLQNSQYPSHHQSPLYSPQLTTSHYPPHFKSLQNSPYIKKPKYPNYFPTSQFSQPAPHYLKAPQFSNYLPLYEDRNARHEGISQFEPLVNKDQTFGYLHSLPNKEYIPDSDFQAPSLLNDEQSYGYPSSYLSTVFNQKENNKQHEDTAFKKTFGYPPSSSSTEFRPPTQINHKSTPPIEESQPPSFSSFLAARDSVRDDRDEIFSQKGNN